MRRRSAIGAVLALAVCGGLLAQSTGDKWDKTPDQDMKKELDQFKVFIQEHPRALEELKKDPSLIRTAAFAEEHQGMRPYLEQHTKVKDELKKYPDFFANLTATNQGGQHKNHPADK